jgi:extracellular matrix regulatory protein A
MSPAEGDCERESGMQLLNIGFGNTVMVERIIAVINTGSSPARKLKELAKTEGKLVDVTEGRRTRSILVMDSNHIILSSVQPDTISQRILAMQPSVQLAELALAEKHGGQGDL